jgi:hypothetical protein
VAPVLVRGDLPVAGEAVDGAGVVEAEAATAVPASATMTVPEAAQITSVTAKVTAFFPADRRGR